MVERSSTIRKKARALLTRSKAACHICGLPIRYDLPHTDPEAFVADHVIPLHKGGADALSNIRASHKSCNSRKRARVYAPIVRQCGSLK